MTVLAVAGCSSSQPERPPAAPSSAPSDTGEPVAPTRARIGVVRGKLPAAARRRVVDDVQRAFDTWVDAAFLGSYPRTDFDDAYPGFAVAAADRARKEGLMSNADVGAKLDSATPLLRRVYVDALAVGRRPVTATARFTFVEHVVGPKIDRRERREGRLLLTKTGGGWQVFGYVVKGSTR